MKENSRFQMDHVLRDASDVPLARVVLKDGFIFEKGKPIPVVILMVANSLKINPLTHIYYADGHPYKVPANIPSIRVTNSPAKKYVNSFILEPQDV